MPSLSEILREATQLHASGKLEQARQLYEEIARKDPRHAEALNLLAITLCQLGRHHDAVKYLRQAIAAEPAQAAYYANLGETHRALGQTARAIQCYQQALQLQPQTFEFHNNLGGLLHLSRQYDDAIASYRRALELQPHNLDTQCNLGSAQQSQKKLAEAREQFERVLTIDPNHARAWMARGDILAAENQFALAQQSYERAMALEPGIAERHCKLGIVLRQQDQVPAAIASFRQALAIDPHHVESLRQLGNTLVTQGQPHDALTCLQQALERQPNSAILHNDLGVVWQRLGQLAETCQAYQLATELDPHEKVFQHNLATALQSKGDLEGSLAAYQRAIDLDANYAEAICGRGMILLALGRWDEGWKDYERRVGCPEFDTLALPTPRWDGSPLAGRTLLVHCEQGLGDTFQFLRYLRSIPEDGGRVMVAAQRPLVALLRECGIAHVVSKADPLPQHDVQIPLISLPHLFGTTLANVPAEVPYLAANAELVSAWRKTLEPYPGLKVGIHWHGSKAFSIDTRSIPLTAFEPLARVPGVTLFSLQKNLGSEELPAFSEKLTVVDLGPELDEQRGPFMDSAAVMQSLDLVITCDTAIAHLAGGLGVPVWVPLSSSPEWRWMEHRADSPWYPTMRLFRQRQWQQWSEPLEQMAGALCELVVANDPQDFAALTALGNRACDTGQWIDAQHYFERVLALQPESAAAHYNLGNAQQGGGNLEGAVTSYRRALTLEPDYAEALCNLGNALAQLGQLDEALEDLRRSVQLRPDYATAHNNLGCVCQQVGQIDEAVQAFRRAVEIDPQQPLHHTNLGGALVAAGEIAAAFGCYDRALAIDPDHPVALYSRSTAQLSLGQYDEGWAGHEQRVRCPRFDTRDFDEPKWDGSPLAGRTLLVHCEQGFGDTMQFARYLRAAARQGDTIVVAAQPALVELLELSGVPGRVVSIEGPLPRFDVHAPLMSLPYVLRNSIREIPCDIPYLAVEPARVERWRAALEPIASLRVGIAWQGRKRFMWDRLRSIPLENFAPLAAVPGVSLLSLQKGPGSEQIAEVAARFTVADLAATLDVEGGAFLDIAAVMQSLDVVIASDTAVAHLAGALGVPVWVALSTAADWRWGRDRDDSPWYPGMRLFRQTRLGHWPDVFERMAAALAAIGNARRRQ